MYKLSGEYYCKLDAKGRLMIPAGLRKQLPENLVIKKGFENNIELFPEDIWNKQLEVINALNMFIEKNRRFRNFYMRGNTHLQADSVGRILLSKNLMQECSMSSDVVLVGRGELMEIWDKTAYEQSFESMTSEDFSAFAEEVMGSNKGGTDV